MNNQIEQFDTNKKHIESNAKINVQIEELKTNIYQIEKQRTSIKKIINEQTEFGNYFVLHLLDMYHLKFMG